MMKTRKTAKKTGRRIQQSVKPVAESTETSDVEILTDENGEPLVENINANEDETRDINPSEAKKTEEGVDNIVDDKADLREDMKADSLGGSTQVPAPKKGGTASG